MRSFYNRPFQVAASYLGISLLAAGTVAAGQSHATQDQGAHASAPQVASSGGWKRVGDAPDQGPPPAASVENNAAGQSGVVPGQNQPMDPDPMPPAGAVQNQGP